MTDTQILNTIIMQLNSYDSDDKQGKATADFERNLASKRGDELEYAFWLNAHTEWDKRNERVQR